jgi:hypothetical protein
VGDDRDVVFARHCLLRPEVPPHEGPIADQLIEEAGSQVITVNMLRLFADGQVEHGTPDHSQDLKNCAFALPIQIVAGRNHVPVPVRLGPHHHQLFGVWIGKIRDQAGVEDAIDRSIRANAESQSQRHSGGKARTATHHAAGIAKIFDCAPYEAD